MTRSVALSVDDDLVVRVGPGGDDWTYEVTVVRDGEAVTTYGSNFEPWGRAGVTMLGNILAARVHGYDSKARVKERLEDAFAARAEALEQLDDT